MANEKELLIKIKDEYKNVGLKELNTALNDNKAAMEKLVESGKRGSQAFQELKTRSKALKETSSELKRELNGQSAQVKMSRLALLEMGENITVLVAGLSRLAKQFAETAKQGAEYGVLKDKFIELSGGIEQAEQKLLLLRQASSGNLDDKNLIEYSNKMKLLGFSSDDTAKFLDIVERKSDEVGVSFETGKSALEAYILTGRGKGLKELGINIADVNKAMEKMTGATIEQIGKLEAADQQTLRTKVILSQFGDTIDNINKKPKDTADKLASLETALTNLRLEYGKVISNGIVKFAESLGISDDKVVGHTKSVGVLLLGLKDILPVLATLKIAFPSLWAAAGAGIGTLVSSIGSVAIAGGAAMAVIEDLINNWMPFSFQLSNPGAAYYNYARKQAENFIKNLPPPPIKSLDEYVKGATDKIAPITPVVNTWKENDDKKKKAEEQRMQDALNKIKTDTNKGGSGKTKAEEITTDLSRLQEELKNTKDELEKVKADLTLQGVAWNENTVAILQYTDAITKLDEKIKFLQSTFNDVYKTNPNLNDNIKNRTEDALNKNVFKDGNGKKVGALGISDEDIRLAKLYALDNKQKADTENKAGEDRRNEIISSEGFQAASMMLTSLGDVLSNSLGQAWEDTFGEANSLFEQFMQTVTTQLINNLINKAISGILNSIFPGLGLLSGSLFGGGAGGAVPGRATGGSVKANQMYMTGERGMELFVPNSNGYIFNNKQTMSALQAQSANKVTSNQQQTINKYFALEMDGMKFLEKNYPHYKSKRLFRQL